MKYKYSIVVERVDGERLELIKQNEMMSYETFVSENSMLCMFNDKVFLIDNDTNNIIYEYKNDKIIDLFICDDDDDDEWDDEEDDEDYE